MTELLAFLTACFVIYVLYEVFKTVSQPGGESREAETPPTVSPPSPAVAAPAPKPAAVVAEQAAAAPAPAPQPAAAPAPAHTESRIHNLRNPKTGEISPAPGNYRFAKKWIKEALVKEGLLNKVYKNSELTETINAKAKDALEHFKKLEQYHA